MRLMKSSEKGQALVLIALAAVVLVGFVAIAIDGSAKYSDRRHAQNAADTAALEAALSLVNGETTACGGREQWQCDALLLAEDNGYDDLTNNEVWVFKCDSLVADRDGAPLGCGVYEGLSNYVSVIILSHVNTTFARVLGFEQTHNLVQTVTYFKEGGNLTDGAMIISYDDSPNCSTGGTGGYSVQVSGSATVNLYGGGIMLNSDEVCGFKIPNCADLNIHGGTINSVGDNIDTTGCTFDPPFTPNTDEAPIVIPEDVYWPDVPPECSTAAPSPTKLGEIMVAGRPQPVEEWLIYPGFYTVFPPAGPVANRSYIYMASGVYCIEPDHDADLSWSPVEAAILNGSTSSDPGASNYNKYHAYNPDGITLYIRASGGFSINTQSPTYLDASTDGDYQGYLIILEGTHTDHPSCTINGGADIHLNGLIFAPYCNFVINGKAGETAEINAQLIGWDIRINGDNTINFNYDPNNQVIIKRRIGLMK